MTDTERELAARAVADTFDGKTFVGLELPEYDDLAGLPEGHPRLVAYRADVRVRSRRIARRGAAAEFRAYLIDTIPDATADAVARTLDGEEL